MYSIISLLSLLSLLNVSLRLITAFTGDCLLGFVPQPNLPGLFTDVPVLRSVPVLFPIHQPTGLSIQDASHKTLPSLRVQLYTQGIGCL